MIAFLRIMLCLGSLSSAPIALAAGAHLSPAQEQRLMAMFKRSERFEHEGDAVHAYLNLREAQRLEQVWTNNVVGDDALSAQRMNRLVTTLIRRDDASVTRILHSKSVALGDKLSLLHILEQDILLNYPGSHEDSLLTGYEE